MAGAKVLLINKDRGKLLLENNTWIGPFTVKGRVVDTIELIEKPGSAYHVSMLRLLQR